ncbi:NB-ARC domain-containing protein [Allokutzneria sp. A3M-2-11 16]|uniref:AfsR/SARP family transcriptional regulator n=1 Tax=Allokutzneria sp. A3M-2-11 16 TaxID=2962043 RepID=UPI0020B6EEF9|nr:BTAD domain-containing putative transcriptional regulator [Allokutzneria sp. A3M-2-11 16]MCP3802502.1 NB-ARC domain-containing protein [Allokutzneria sp. A3M-2-11 16]
MEFRLLGPLEVVAGNEIVRIPAAKHRALLAALLLRANQVVPSSELITQLWGEEPPSSARTTLQGYVLRLRRTLGPVIVTRNSGYLIEVDEDSLDLRRFERLVERSKVAESDGDLAQAAHLLHAALTLWRGPALADVGSDWMHRVEAPRLAELRGRTLHRRAEIDLRLGKHAEVIGELTVLVAENPLDEGFSAQLMLALHRCGRRAEALEVYRQTRRMLVEELGVEPGPELRRREQEVLRSDPEQPRPRTAEPMRAPHVLPPDIADFIGRAEEAESLRSALRPVPGGCSPQVITVVGMAGVGKTALAVHVAHSLRAEFPDGQLFARLRTASGSVNPTEVLGRFLRLLGMLGSHLPEDVEQLAELLRDRLSGRRVLLVLDDAVDAAQVRPLLPGDGGCAVLVTGRNRLTGLTGRSVDLDVLTEPQAIELLGEITGVARISAEPDAAGVLVRRCGLLPLALRIAAARLRSRPQRTVAWLAEELADEHRRLDRLVTGDLAVRASIGLSEQGLDEECRRALRLLSAVKVPHYPAWLSAAVLDRSPEQTERIIDDLLDAQLLEDARGTGGSARVRFHELVRIYAEEQLEQAPEPVLERAFPAMVRAAEEVSARLPSRSWTAGVATEKPCVGLDWFTAEQPVLVGAVRQAATVGDADSAWRLTAALTGYLDLRGEWDDWRRTHCWALSACRSAGDWYGAARMSYGLGLLAAARDRYPQGMRWFARALSSWRSLGARSEAGYAWIGIGDMYHQLSNVRRASRCFRRAATIFAEISDERGAAWARLSLALALRDRGERERALESLLRTIDDFDRLGDWYSATEARFFLALTYNRWEQPEQARSYAEPARTAFAEMGARLKELRCQRLLGHVLASSGDPGAARPLLEECVREFRDQGDTFSEAVSLWSLGELIRGHHAPADAVEILTKACALFTKAGVPTWRMRAAASLQSALRGG